MKPIDIANSRQDPFFSDGLVQQPYYGASQQTALTPYPGVGGYSGYGANTPSTALVAPEAAPSGGLSIPGLPFNMTQIKGFMDRLGGIEGIMGHVSRFQKFFQSMQQMAPMIKVLMNSFGKAKTAAKLDGDGLTAGGRRRRRSKSSTRRKASSKKITKRKSR